MLASAKVRPSAGLLKFDDNEFFLSGSHLDLANAVPNPLEGKLAGWIRDCTLSLLSSQCVEFESSTHMRVLQGSGMAMRPSVPLATSPFL